MKDFQLGKNSSGKASAFANYLEAFCSVCVGKNWSGICKKLDLDLKSYCVDSESFFPIVSLSSTLAFNSGIKVGFDRIEEILRNCPPVNPYTLKTCKAVYVTSSINTISTTLLFDLSRALMGS